MEAAMQAVGKAIFGTISVVALPKYVSISNFRLGLLFNLLRVTAVAGFVFIMISSKSFYLRVSVQGFPTQWVSSPQKEYSPAVVSDLQKPFCTSSDSFNYKYDDEWTYQNMSCVEQFPEERRGYKEGSDTLFMPTFYAETATDRRKASATTVVDGKTVADCSGMADPCSTGWRAVASPSATAPLCECVRITSHFVAGVESLRIGLEHYFTFSSSSTTSLDDMSASQSSSASCQSDDKRWECLRPGKELMTMMVMEGTKKVIHVSHAPSPISLQIADVLEGAEISLDDAMTDTVQNKLLCGALGADPATCVSDAKEFPLVRMTGLDIQIRMDYLNKEFFPTGYAELDGHDGPLCFVTISATPKWVSLPVTDCARPRDSITTEMMCTQRYRYGIRVSTSTMGTFGVYDLQNLLVTLGAGLVYLALPLQLIGAVALYCLGPASAVYRQVSKQPCKIDDELADLATKALIMRSAFDQIADGGTLTVSDLRMQLQEAFQSDDLDEKELDHLVRCAFTKLMQSSEKAETGNSTDGITLHGFMAHMDTDMNVKEAIQLFDRQRRRNPIEILFRPEFVKSKAFKVAPSPSDK